MSQHLIIILIVELIVITLFNGRANGLFALMNLIVFGLAIFFTFQEYHWSFMLLVPILAIPVVGLILSDIVYSQLKSK